MGNDNEKHSTKSHSPKMEAALKRVNAENAGEMATIAPPDITGMLFDSSQVGAALADKVNSGAWEQAPQLLTLKEGQTIIATLEGNGVEAEFTDEDTGIVNYEKTWVLAKNGVRVSILGSVQLNKKLPPFIGGEVAITRGRDIRNGSKLYTDYLVMGPKRADGAPRDWSTRPMLAAPAEPTK